MSFKAVIFDFDGVVVHSYANHLRGFAKAAEKIGMELDLKEVHKRFGRSEEDIIRELFPKMLRKDVKKFVNLKNKFYMKTIRKKGVELIPHVSEVLKFLKKKKIKVGIASSSSRFNLMMGLRETGIRKFFESIVAAEDVKNHKPDPEPLFKITKMLKVNPAECIYIGDSANEMIAARRAKIYGVGITTGAFSRKQLAKAGAKKVFRNHREFLKFLKSSL